VVSACAALAAAGVGLLWKMVAGTGDASSPDRLAATTAASVAEAARQQIVDAADGEPEDLPAVLRATAAGALTDAAAAGADLTAAAFGALQAAQLVAGNPGDPAIVDSVGEGLREAAASVGPLALERVDRVVRALA
jgi:hypothetical protein